jgi:outer membrane receptor protein involved in Fe transport
LPGIAARTVRGASSPADALRQMLKGSGYHAVPTGPSSFRIERLPRAAHAASTPSTPIEEPSPDIVVTALKRPQLLTTLPGTVSVIFGDNLRSAAGLAGSDAIGRQLPSLTTSSLGPGLNRLFLRGIGDGPLNGFNQGSVAVLLDEARINYDAPDPDWALIDIDRVEVLEGPQGPLYGTGALGGIVKLSTTAPDLGHSFARVSTSGAVVEGGGFSNAQSLTANLPLASQRLGVRAVAYRDQQAGWIDNAGGDGNINRLQLVGGRLAIRWIPAGHWTVDLIGALQSRNTRDSQYADGNVGPLRRPDRLREPRDLDAKIGMLTIKGPIGRVELTSITSFSRQEAAATYDAAPLAPILGTVGPTSVDDARNYDLFDQEVRIQNRSAGGLEWLAGLSFINATTDTDIVAKDASTGVPLLRFRRSISEAAAFGEASAKIGRGVILAGGGRVFSVGIDDEGQEANSSGALSRRSIRAAADASITWKPSAKVTAFLHAASGYRPGGINVQRDASQPTYEADELASVELGSRIKLREDSSAEATVFASRWQHVQTDELLTNGLVATRNAGNAHNYGLEGRIHLAVGKGTMLTGGLILQSARLASSNQGSEIEDRRLPAVPQLAARVELGHRFHWGSWDGEASIGGRYIGATHLSFDPVLDRRTPGHALMDAHVSLSRDGWTAELLGENLTNSTADTFGFGNPYRVRLVPQRTPARPRSIGISLSRSF